MIIKFIHIFREANGAAHAMVHLSPLDYSTRVWVEGFSVEIDGVIASDFCLAINKI